MQTSRVDSGRRVHPGERVIDALLQAVREGRQLVLRQEPDGALAVYSVPDQGAVPSFVRIGGNRP